MHCYVSFYINNKSIAKSGFQDTTYHLLIYIGPKILYNKIKLAISISERKKDKLYYFIEETWDTPIRFCLIARSQNSIFIRI